MSDAGRECPFCRADLGPGGVPRAEHLDPEVLLLVLANNPWWRPEAGLCAPCAAGFAAADLIGIPWQILVGPKGLAEGKLELKRRSDGTRENLSPAEVVAKLVS